MNFNFGGFPISALFGRQHQTMNSPMTGGGYGNSMGQMSKSAFAPDAYRPPAPGATMIPGGLQPAMPPQAQTSMMQPTGSSMPTDGGSAFGGQMGGMSPLLMAMMSGGGGQQSQPAASPIGAAAGAMNMPINAMMMQRLGLFGKN